MHKTAVYWLAVAIFFAGAAFQEAITGTWLNVPDGGNGSLTISIFALFVAHVLTRAARNGA